MAFSRALSDLANVAGRGKYTVTPVAKFGFNADIDQTEEDIWTVGGVRSWSTTSATLEVISASTLDASTRTGARAITIEGLDSNWNLATSVLTTNGTAASAATTTSYRRVNRAYVSSVGTYHGANTGALTIRYASAGATQAQIAAGTGQTEQTHYTVPNDHTLHLLSVWASSDASLFMSPTLWQNPSPNDLTSPYSGAKRKIWGASGVANIERKFDVFPAISGPADLWISAASESVNTAVQAGFDAVLVDN